MVNNCLFLDNAAVTTGAGVDAAGAGGAIGSSVGKLTVVDSIFKKNKAIATASGFGGGGAISAAFNDVLLVLSSVFELNEASNVGGAALLEGISSVALYNNKELLFGNDALDCDGAKVFGGEPCVGVEVECDGAKVFGGDCFGVEDNFSL